MALPKSWKEISIKKFLEIHTINEKIKDEFEREIHILACLDNLPYSDVEKFSVKKIKAQSASLKWMGVLPKEKVPLSFRFNKNIFSTTILFEDMSAGQFIDFVSICDGIKQEELIYQIIHLIGSMVKRRKYKMTPPFIYSEYEGYDKYDFENLPISIAYPLYVFFCKVLTNLSLSMPSYLKQITKNQMKKVREEIKKDLVSIGVGI